MRHGWLALLPIAVTLLFCGGVRPAQAQTGASCVANYGGVLNGNTTPAPVNLAIDGACTIENFQDAAHNLGGVASPNGDYTGTLELGVAVGTPLILSNVDFDGQISCDKPHGNIFWIVNSEVDPHALICMSKVGTIVQVDKIDKSIPSGQTTAAIGVPFTYALTFPQLYDPTTGQVTNPNGSNLPISQVTITDDLNATGVSLSYLSSVATWKGSTCPAPGAPVPFTGPAPNSTGLLTFSGFPTIPAGCQVVVRVTVVLNNTVPPNTPGTTFVNTANWTLGTTLGGTFTFPLPGQQGVSPPLTIVGPALVMTKSGPATMSLGQQGQFSLNLHNTGTTDAWNVTIQDRLPTGPTGGMCAAPPQILSAQIPGKGPLVEGTDYTVSFAAAPTCTLTINLLTPAAVIGPGQTLVINYQTQLDPNTQNGATLTNVAGATQWFNASPSTVGRQSVTCPLTNGTPGVADCQDAHTVTVLAPPPLAITKQVAVVGGGAAVPGATLDYTVHVVNNSTSPASPVVITDNLNAAGAGVLTYVSGSATLTPSSTGVASANGITVTGNVITANYSATYGALAPGASVDLRFRATLGAAVAGGTTVTNTGTVTWGNPSQTASGSVSIVVVAPTPPALVMTKGGPATMSIGQQGQFTLNVQNTGTTDAWNVTIQDRLPSGATGGMCTATPQIISAQVFQADGVTPVPGKGPLTPGTDYTLTYAAAPSCTLTINLLTPAAVIGAAERLIIVYQTQLDANSQNGAQLTNVAGTTQWFNAASGTAGRQTFTCTLTNGTPGVADCQDAYTVTVAAPAGLTITKQVAVVGGGAALPGATLDYIVHVVNNTANPATPLVITDDLNAAGAGVLTYVAGSATLTPSSTGVASANGISVSGNIITGNYSATYGALAPGASVDLHFRATIGSTVAAGTTVTNTATVTWGNPPQTASASVSIVVAPPSALAVTKQVAVVGGGAAVPGATLDYIVHVVNNSANPATPVVITDDLNAAGAGVLTYVAGSASMTPSSTGAASAVGITVTGNVITANYSAIYGALAPGASVDLHFRATLGAAVAGGTTVTNTGTVTWGTPPQTASGSVSITVLAPTPPALVMTKGGPATMSLGQAAQFSLNIQNTGTIDAWNVTIQDRLPAGATGGMCTATPQILSAGVFQSDGVTPVPGKSPLTQGTDYTVSYAAAPACTLTINLLTPAAVIGATQRLIITYQTQLDANSQNGAQLTNVAGTTQWFNAAGGSSGRQTFTCTLTNGTPGVADCQDAHTVTVVAAAALLVTKQVAVVGGGAAVPGATLDYTVHVVNNSTNPATPLVITDDLNAAGAGVLTYVAGSATLTPSSTGVASANGITVAGNVITANYSATYGALAAGASVDLHFRATLGSTLAGGTTVTNTGTATWGTPSQTASGSVSITVVAPTPPALVMTKGGPATMSVGQPAQFSLNIQNTGTTDAWNVTVQDRLPTGTSGGMCTATPQIISAQVFQADGVTAVPGKGPLTLGADYTVSYAGTPTCTLTVNLLSAAAAIGSTQRLIITYQTQLDANSQNGAQLTNVAGATQWFNASSGGQTFTCTLTNGTPGVTDCQDAHTVTVAASSTVAVTKQVSVVGGGAAVPGATLDYLVHVVNNSASPATPLVITDDLNAAGAGVLTYVAGSATLTPSSTGVASANGITVTGNVITANYSATYGALAAGASVDLHFRATLGSTVAGGTTVTNTGTATWGAPSQTASGSVSIVVVAPTPPALVMTKGGPTSMTLGQPGSFTLNIQNTGTTDAWNVTLQDRLPAAATGGMCTATPQILSAQVFQSDGVTAVPGKGPLTPGTDYTVSYAAAPTCTLTINLLTPAAVIGATQRLIITYQTQLDANTQNGATLTNVAGATQWFNAAAGTAGRQSFSCTLTNGTPGVADCQDAHTVTAGSATVAITKQVSVVGGGAAVPGATLDYIVHVVNNSTGPATPLVITDDLNAAGAGVLTYVAGSATLTPSSTGVASANGITVTGNVITANYSATYGALAPGASVDLHFQATLGSAVAGGTTVTNTGKVTWNNPPQSASGSVSIVVAAPTPPALVVTKSGPATLNIGELGSFALDIQNTGTQDAWNVTIQDRLPAAATGGMCTATPQILSAQVFQSDGVTAVPGKGPLTPGTDYMVSYAAAPTCTLTINLLTPAAVIGATQRLIITYQTQLDANTQNGATLTNVAGATQWFNTAAGTAGRQSFSCTLTNGTPGVADCQDAHTVTVATSGLTIRKQVTVVGGGPVVPGATLDYIVHVTNTTTNPATPVVITDDLNAAGAGALTYVAGSATLTPSSTGVASGNGITVAGNVITANYSATYGALAPAASVDLHFRATLGSALSAGTLVTNTAQVSWNNPPQSASGSVSVQVLAPTPPALVMTKSGPATLTIGQQGQFSLNVQNTGTLDAWNVTIQDRLPAGTTGGMCTATPQILSAQVFQADGVTPVAGKGPLTPGTDYTVSYAAAPTCTLTIKLLTQAAVIGSTQRLVITYQTLLDANTQNGAKLTNVAGATQWFNGPGGSPGLQTFTCTLTDGTPGVADCQDAYTVTVATSGLTISKQVTVVGGGPVVPGATLEYLVHVTNTTTNPASPVVITDDLNAAGAGMLTYVNGSATMTPSTTGVASANGVTVTNNLVTGNYSATYGALAAGASADLRFRATLSSQLSAGAAVTNTARVTWDNPPQTATGSVTVVVEVIPVGALTITKTTPLLDVARGQLVPYTITLTNVIGQSFQGVTLVDRFPAGFRYIKGSARIDGTPAEPAVNGLTLTWTNFSFASGAHHTITLLLAVGAGVGEGEFVNRAQALAATGGYPITGEATATVRVVPDPTFDCTDVIGKVFDDLNGNGHQDAGEKGLPGVRVVTTRGLAAVTDEYGRFHITCAITPLEGRGSNFALKLDERTLPSGYRSTTPQVVVERATRGKALRFEFGAAIHRVVSLDLTDAAFEPGSVELRLQWQPRIEMLLTELRKGRSVLHLSYLADVEEPRLAEARLQAIGGSIRRGWQMSNLYELNIEREIFWLRGAPPREPVERMGGPR